MTATVGIPTEIKADENRVALTPNGAHELHLNDVEILVQRGAGEGSAHDDDEYRQAGAELVDRAEEVWERSGVVCKVKEPQETEFSLLRNDLTLFTYLHLAAYPQVAEALVAAGATGIGYETVQMSDGSLPLLAPMSEVAGRMAPQIGARFLEVSQGGRGVLLGGAPGVHPGRVVVIGAGIVGSNAAWIAQGMEAEVILLDGNLDRLRHVDTIHRGRIMTVASNQMTVAEAVSEADVVVGAVLVPGGRAPVLIPEDLVRAMHRGSVIIDIAIDQGGIAATSVETTHSDPVREVHGVLHYGVGNIPGAVPHTSTYALSNATLPYLLALATKGLDGAVAAYPELEVGLNSLAGRIVNPAVAASLGKEYVPPSRISEHASE